MKPIRVMPARVWRTYFGGREIDRLLSAECPTDGERPEVWVASTVEARNPVYTENEGLSQAEDGRFLRELIEGDPNAHLGKEHLAACGTSLGILVKLLDAKNRLTIQVHPTREKARALFNSEFGKTECWYIMGVREDSEEPPYILLGFKPGVTREIWEDLFRRQDIEGMLGALHKIRVKPGEVYFIHGGMPHAIGAGCFITELQEPTDYTVRVERKTPEGLAIADKLIHQGIGFERMFDCFSYETYSEDALIRHCRVEPRSLAEGEGYAVDSLIGRGETEMFHMTRIKVEGEYTFPSDGRYAVMIVLSGEGELVSGDSTDRLRQGDLFFVPAAAEDFCIRASEEMEIVSCGYGVRENY